MSDDRWRPAEPMLGVLQLRPSALTVEAAARSGLDYLFVDGEHGVFGEADFADTIASIRAAGLVSIVRVAGQDPSELRRRGAMRPDALLVPHVSTAAEARALVAAGTGPGGDDTSAGNAGAAPLLLVVLESAEAVDNADEIMAVDGIDGAFIGPTDLSADLGIPGGFSRPEYVAAFDRLEGAVLSAGKILGAPPHPGFPAEALTTRGHRLLVLGSDAGILAEGMAALVAAARDAGAASRSVPRLDPRDA